RPWWAAGSRLRRGLVSDRDDREGPRSVGQLNRHLVVDAFAEQRTPERRVHADVIARHIDLVRSYDAMARDAPHLALERDPRAEVHARAVRGRMLDDDHAL